MRSPASATTEHELLREMVASAGQIRSFDTRSGRMVDIKPDLLKALDDLERTKNLLTEAEITIADLNERIQRVANNQW